MGNEEVGETNLNALTKILNIQVVIKKKLQMAVKADVCKKVPSKSISCDINQIPQLTDMSSPH